MAIRKIREIGDPCLKKQCREVEKFDSKLDKFATALENNNNKLKTIEDDIKVIKEKVGV